MISIREARDCDASALAHLVTDLGYPVAAADLWARIQKMPGELYRTLVAVSENRVVGFVGLLTLPVYEHDQPIGWFLALCVAPDQRGQGIGRALVHAAEEYYRSQNVVDVRLHSGLQRNGAHQFYEKMGFDRSGYRFKKKLC